jgi:type II secretory ATPase GspE/PulE/Tfp pilus assembly ATPase PilB-like protein
VPVAEGEAILDAAILTIEDPVEYEIPGINQQPWGRSAA